MAELPLLAKELIEDTNLAHIVTLMKDGSPQVTPLWVDHDGTHVLVNTARGRQKDLNLRRDPRVALSIVDRKNGQRYVQVRGIVAEITEEGAFEHINKLGRKYRGPDFKFPQSGETRVIIKIVPEHVQVSGV